MSEQSAVDQKIEAQITKASQEFLDVIDAKAKELGLTMEEAIGAAILALGGLCVGAAVAVEPPSPRFESNTGRYGYAASMGQALACAVMHHFSQLPTDEDVRH